MKKIISFIILGCLSLYGFSINPTDPLVKTGEGANTITAQSPVTTDECSDLLSLVDVTVIVTFTDCPAYDCEFKNCSFNICIYDEDMTTCLKCKPFNPNTCSYTIDGFRAEEGHTLYSHLVAVLPNPCTHQYNDGFDGAPNGVPAGGGTVNINTTYCQ